MLENYTCTKYRVLLILFCFFSITVTSQLKPRFVDANDATLNNLCVYSNVVSYHIRFSPGSNGSGSFIVQLSDANGDFSSPESLGNITLSPGSGNQGDIVFNGVQPYGDNYRIRLKSTSGSASYGEESDPLAIHYYDTNSVPLQLKGKNASLKVVICVNGDTTLSLNKSGTYKWYKILSSGDVLIPGESSQTLIVSSVGKYKARPAINCAVSWSNIVDVSIMNASAIDIGTSNVLICSNEKHIFTASVQDIAAYKYEWYRNGTLIPGAIGYSYETVGNSSQFGDYKVRASSKSNPDCSLISPEISLTENPGGFDVALEVPNEIFLTSATTVDLEISYTIGNATVEWFKNNNVTAILGATSKIYNNATAGVYYAEVTTTAGTTGACSPKTTSEEIKVLSVDGFRPIIKLSDNYKSCEFSATKIKVETKIISSGNDYDIPTSIASGLTYKWFRKTSGGVYQAISQTTTEFDLSSNIDNGTYKVEVKSPLLSGTFVSNEIDVNLLVGDFKIEYSSLSSGAETELSVSPKIVGVSYTWFKDGAKISTDEKIIVSERAKYSVEVKAFGCVKTLEFKEEPEKPELTLAPEKIQNIISPFNGDQNNDFWVLPDKFMQDSIRVIVYNTQGEELLNTTAYQNNWPSSPVEIGEQMILYYKIINKENLVQAGTISVIK